MENGITSISCGSASFVPVTLIVSVTLQGKPVVLADAKMTVVQMEDDMITITLALTPNAHLSTYPY
jgi:hypothetical protein